MAAFARRMEVGARWELLVEEGVLTGVVEPMGVKRSNVTFADPFSGSWRSPADRAKERFLLEES